ncbi:MAG: hypothetical protein U0326_21245 [Polyangiales bacterium]
MKRWIRVFAPLAVVLSVNLFAAYGDNWRVAWQRIAHGCGDWGSAVFAVTALGVALLGLASATGPRAWVVLIPTLPPFTAALGVAVQLRALRPAIIERASYGSDAFGAPSSLSPDLIRTWASDHGMLRALAAQQGLALALATLLVAWRWSPWPRERRAPIALAMIPLGLATLALWGPVTAISTPSMDVSALMLLLVALAILAPATLATSFRGAAPDGAETPPSTPYRAPLDAPYEAPSVDAPSIAVMVSLVMPWLARGLLRGTVAMHAAWWPFSVDPFAVTAPSLNLALLAFASRWDRYVLTLGVTLALVALVRGADRRGLRMWAVAVALLLAGDITGARSLRAIRDTMLRARHPHVWLATPGAAWLERMPDLSHPPTEELIWRASGEVAAVPPPSRSASWHAGPLVHVDPAMTARVWRAQLRRWRATSPDGVLTLSGGCPPDPRSWLSDSRQEVDLSNTPGITECHTVAEVAPLDGAVTDTLRVMSASRATLLDARGETHEIDLRTWRPGPETQSITVIAGDDTVRASVVVNAARRLYDGRRRVLFG